jgi:putative addiction module component (TIGR02574 family)
MNLATTLTEIAAMNIDDRIRLVQAIWDTIAQDANQLQLTDAQKHELDRRIADMDANPDDEVPWEPVYAESLKRVQQ